MALKLLSQLCLTFHWPKQITWVNLMLISEEVCASPMKGLQVTWKCVGYIILLQEMWWIIKNNNAIFQLLNGMHLTRKEFNRLCCSNPSNKTNLIIYVVSLQISSPHFQFKNHETSSEIWTIATQCICVLGGKMEQRCFLNRTHH